MIAYHRVMITDTRGIVQKSTVFNRNVFTNGIVQFINAVPRYIRFVTNIKLQSFFNVIISFFATALKSRKSTAFDVYVAATRKLNKVRIKAVFEINVL